MIKIKLKKGENCFKKILLIRYPEYNKDENLEKMNKIIDKYRIYSVSGTNKNVQNTSYLSFFDPQYRKPILICLLAYFLMMFSFYGSNLIFTPLVKRTIDDYYKKSRIDNSIIYNSLIAQKLDFNREYFYTCFDDKIKNDFNNKKFNNNTENNYPYNINDSLKSNMRINLNSKFNDHYQIKANRKTNNQFINIHMNKFCYYLDDFYQESYIKNSLNDLKSNARKNKDQKIIIEHENKSNDNKKLRIIL